MALLRLPQKFGESADVRAESTSGKAGCDLLQQPAVAVRITERGKRAVAGMIGRGPADTAATTARPELSSRRRGVKHFADLDAASDQLVACSLNVGDDQVEALRRTSRRRRDFASKLH